MKTIHIAIAIYTDVGRHTAQIFTNQFDDGDVLGSLFLISHDDLLGIGQGGVDGALHRIGIDATIIDADKGLGREADKALVSILQHQFIFSLGVEEDLLQREVAAHGHRTGEIDEVGVACFDMALHNLEALLVVLI